MAGTGDGDWYAMAGVAGWEGGKRSLGDGKGWRGSFAGEAGMVTAMGSMGRAESMAGRRREEKVGEWEEGGE